ncbi:MAG TPA: glycosyltransferase family 4 protein [Patescibacteria group bacterium]|nr:glycosyltransferase family 4 protein [Patescibacteria group bacterium]
MRILMLTPYLPYPPTSGGQIRSYNLIKQLSALHEITLCSLIKFDSEEKYVDKLKPFCKNIYVFKRAKKPWTLSNILNTAFSLYPFLVIRNFSKEQKTRLREILSSENFDLIHAETFYVSPHIPQTDIPVVLVDQTIEYQVYRHYVNNFRIGLLRPILMLDVMKIRYWETHFWKKAARVIAVSDRDAAVMKHLVKGLKVTVIPNGVGEDLTDEVPLHFKKTILFMGNYAWLQNVEAARVLATRVFPGILEKIPDCKLIIAGQNTLKISDLETESIELKDFAVDDIASVKKAYQENGIMVAPLYGPGGTRLKILAAMASKMPVVTTDIGNEGIDAINNESVLIGNGPESLAPLAVKLFKDLKLYKKIALNAKALVESSYSYGSIAKKLSNVYKQVVEDRK